MRPFYIGTIRFTSETFKENKKWREKNNWKGCIYGTSVPIAEHIEIDEKIIIIEMMSIIIIHESGLGAEPTEWADDETNQNALLEMGASGARYVGANLELVAYTGTIRFAIEWKLCLKKYNDVIKSI